MSVCLRPSTSVIARANSTARIAAAIASGQKLSLGELFTGLYWPTIKPTVALPVGDLAEENASIYGPRGFRLGRDKTRRLSTMQHPRVARGQGGTRSFPGQARMMIVVGCGAFAVLAVVVWAFWQAFSEKRTGRVKN